MRRITLSLLVACALAACGQKGALYLPGEEREAVTTTAVEPADSATDEERERAAAAGNTRPN